MGKEGRGSSSSLVAINLQLGSFLVALMRGEELASPFVLAFFFPHVLNESFVFFNSAGFLVVKRLKQEC